MEINLSNCDIFIAETCIFKEISLDIQQGEFIRLTGRNGSGKTTLLNTLLGVNRNIKGSNVIHYEKKEICYITESPFFLDDDKVSEVINTLIFFYEVSLSEIKCILEELDFSYSSNKNKKISQLSSGMRKKLLILPIFFKNLHLFALDEIFTGLDKEMQEKVLQQIICNQSKKQTTILIEHNEEIAIKLKNSISSYKEILCENQKIIQLS